MKIFCTLAVLIGLSACTIDMHHVENSTVKITNLAGNSGGSGSILSSTDSKSEILTNSHVCEVVKKGGLVHSTNSRAFVTSYKQSKVHDLCLITVSENLFYNNKVATEAPLLETPSVVSGHPQLLPTIVSKGHFAGKMMITILTGNRPCTEEEKSGDLGLICSIFGAIPIIKTYETMVVSNFIQPGSSGSAIYNSEGDIAGVIFAGNGQMSYGIAVPHEYVYNFIHEELITLDAKHPDTTTSTEASSPRSINLEDMAEKIVEKCKEKKLTNQLCKDIAKTLEYDDLIYGKE